MKNFANIYKTTTEVNVGRTKTKEKKTKNVKAKINKKNYFIQTVNNRVELQRVRRMVIKFKIVYVYQNCNTTIQNQQITRPMLLR